MSAKRQNRPARKPFAPPARAAALHALFLCLHRNQDAQAALDSALSGKHGLGKNPDPRDAGLATELFYGYLRMKGRVDALLDEYLKNPDKLPPRALLGLGLAAHELLFLDRVPAYATVDWAVTYAKGFPGRLSGLFNAVLRNIDRLGTAAHDPAHYAVDNNAKDSRGAMDAEAQSLARYHSCPAWLVRLWLDAYGSELAGRYLEAQSAAPAVGLEALDHEAGEILAGHPQLLDAAPPGYALDAGSKVPPELQGRVARQSFAARQALLALHPQDMPEPIWDACSGRGGKTRLLSAMGRRVFASDVHMGRLKALHRELPQVPVFRTGADRPSPLAQPPGTILLDLPCSGLGVLSRRPDAKWKRTPHDLHDLAALQARILDNAAVQLDPGGVLAVITCTLNPDENEGLIRSFLERTPHMRLEHEWTTAPESALGEFFYAARLVKTG